MSSNAAYAEMIKEAEAAVASVKDAELKRVAFEKILDALLAKGGTTTPASAVEKPARKKSGRRATRDRSGGERRSGGPQKYIEEMIDENFFKTPKTLAGVKAELTAATIFRSHTYPGPCSGSASSSASSAS
jgi:hypothetical protein